VPRPIGAPVIGPPFAEDNTPRFRDGKPWPESITGADLLNGVALGQEAGYTIVNARTVWDAGGMLGYCTDSGYEPRAGLEHELKSYNVVFSMQDLIKLMGPNTASYIQMGDQLGTLELVFVNYRLVIVTYGLIPNSRAVSETPTSRMNK